MRTQGEANSCKGLVWQRMPEGKKRLRSFVVQDIVPFLLMLVLTSWLTIKAAEIISVNRPTLSSQHIEIKP